jgi:RimJ/RimL family protein N-acetyltransferase
MTIMNYLDETKKYYAEWLGVSPELLHQAGKFYLSYSPNRDIVQEGYNKPFDLYAYLSGETTIVTYGQELVQSIDWIHSSFKNTKDIAELRRIFYDHFGKILQLDYKYYFSKLPLNIDYSKAKQLTLMDYPAYLQFFKTQYPDSGADLWLGDYYKRIVSKGYAFGLYVGDELVSVSDSPDMPYMKNDAIEIGMNTLPAHQNKGYAKVVLGAMLGFIINIPKVPIVSCTSSNIASQRLIESIGFLKLADVVSLSS